ncbi:hypothetical protein GMOD_00000049 [Pyrenophora seminiperda CCB06]|uniref:Uncharacterized protein n=1 Tax=Pyrenophora seminiperda CCB06 TaxID=1302712 RepID=A0A3M7M686_9PLEO|nr:hypothetical protein GMOD_00000049 [Pyrenophora seminiperda CCB06]
MHVLFSYSYPSSHSPNPHQIHTNPTHHTENQSHMHLAPTVLYSSPLTHFLFFTADEIQHIARFPTSYTHALDMAKEKEKHEKRENRK